VSINNFPELVDFRDNKLSAAEQLPPDDPNWQDPSTGTAAQYKVVLPTEAWSALQKSYDQRKVDQSRQRKTEERTSAVAASTSNASAMADKVTRSLSLINLSDKPTPANRPKQPSRIVAILSKSKSKKKYRVRWSEPEGNPETSDVSVSWMDKRVEYGRMVRAFEEQLEQLEQQEVQEEQQTEVIREDEVEEDTDVEPEQPDVTADMSH